MDARHHAPRRRFLLGTLSTLLWGGSAYLGVAGAARADPPPDSPLDADERKRLRRELRQAHRERWSEGKPVQGNPLAPQGLHPHGMHHPRGGSESLRARETQWERAGMPVDSRHAAPPRNLLSDDERAQLREQIRAQRREHRHYRPAGSMAPESPVAPSN